MKISLFFILLFSAILSFGQMSHAELAEDIIGDLKEALADSLGISHSDVYITLKGESEASKYLAQRFIHLLENTSDDRIDAVSVELTSLELSIDKHEGENFRNSPYIRKLKLSVIFDPGNKSRVWTSSVSDRVSKAELQVLLDEPFPGQISGNYRDIQPTSLRIIILTFATLSLVAALYFIRT